MESTESTERTTNVSEEVDCMWTVETVSHVGLEGLDWVSNSCTFRGEVSRREK